MLELQTILLGCQLDEEIKWGKPCYSAEGANIAIMQPFQGFLSLMFFKGALLKDPKGLLRSQGENTQSALRMEFTRVGEVTKARSAIKAFVKDALAVEKAGLKVAFKKATDRKLPEELTERFKQDKAYKQAFAALTPGRQRSYLLHFASAKQSKTRVARIEKCRADVLAGKGFNER